MTCTNREAEARRALQQTIMRLRATGCPYEAIQAALHDARVWLPAERPVEPRSGPLTGGSASLHPRPEDDIAPVTREKTGGGG